ncbi:uncharacterized protein N7483_004619 [Penicillium malachiteum]|uniref:uncharacterized protein n=1 Tax=Penicillium malachiteum TaxID=1324776 RepID=UPI002548AB00|nr:uncharacterized protein N7483_004619 [Penicillium malachiteum]KAJ5730111.1 hypothetical protein N7483_004619 [Penicillium malachiteum]
MLWLKLIFTNKSKEEIRAEEQSRRQSKSHIKRVLARERELRLAQDGGGVKSARLFFGSPLESYTHAKHGKRTKENFSNGLMKSI